MTFYTEPDTIGSADWTAMKELRTGVSRRAVIEAWIQYDARKKSRPVPDFEMWPWESADHLERTLGHFQFKTGIIAGYLSWTFNALTLDDLRRCAIVNHAIPGAPKCLGQLEGTDELQSWQPDRETDWYERLSAGGDLTMHEPLLVRQSMQSESPANWYLEDGSGRALAIVKAACHSGDAVVGYAYVGAVPDRASTFMQSRFRNLLE